MKALAAGIRRIWDALFAVAFALAGFQITAIMAIYRQRLDQKLMDIEQALAVLRASATPDAATIARYEAELPVIRRTVAELGETGLGRIHAFLTHFDAAIVWRIRETYEPSLPLTLEAAAYAAAAALVGLILAALLAGVVRAIFFRPSRRMENF